jgi:hypothetical protein
MLKLKTQTNVASITTENFFPQMEAHGLWTAEQYVLETGEGGGDYVQKWYTLRLSKIVVHEVINNSLHFFYPAS